VRFTMTSSDVIHSLYIPKFGVKQDIFPSQETIARTRPTETRSYRLYCAELCGSGHSNMQATVVVMNQSDYDDWMAKQQGTAGTTTAGNETANATANATATPNVTATPSANIAKPA